RAPSWAAGSAGAAGRGGWAPSRSNTMPKRSPVTAAGSRPPAPIPGAKVFRHVEHPIRAPSGGRAFERRVGVAAGRALDGARVVARRRLGGRGDDVAPALGPARLADLRPPDPPPVPARGDEPRGRTTATL